VHRRRHKHRACCRNVKRGKKIVGDSVGKLRERVCRRGRNQQQIDRLRQLDVLNLRVVRRREHVCYHGESRYRLEGERRYELSRVPSHHDSHARSAFLKPAQDLDRFISCYASGYAKRDSHFSHQLIWAAWRSVGSSQAPAALLQERPAWAFSQPCERAASLPFEVACCVSRRATPGDTCCQSLLSNPLRLLLQACNDSPRKVSIIDSIRLLCRPGRQRSAIIIASSCTSARSRSSFTIT